VFFSLHGRTIILLIDKKKKHDDDAGMKALANPLCMEPK
jgi:hypothetical protein